MQKLNMWLRRNWFIVFLVCLASFLRLYNFTAHLEFLDDQGRDAIIIQRILMHHKVTLLGPTTSVGTMYLGPLYYYTMVPFLALTYPSPIGLGLGVVASSVLTTVLLFILGKKMIGTRAAVFASLWFASSPIVIMLSRFSWQPNPAPLFGLLAVYGVWLGRQHKSSKGWILAFISSVLFIHIHYVGLLVGLTVAIFFLIHSVQYSQQWKTHIKLFGLWVVFFVLSISPLVAFDIRHGGIIYRGFLDFFQGQGYVAPLTQKIYLLLKDFHGRGMFALVEFVGFSKERRALNTVLLLGLVLGSIWLAIRSKSKTATSIFRQLCVWLAVLIVGISVYRGPLYYHYIAYSFPIVVLWLSFAFDKVFGQGRIPRLLGSLIFAVFVIWNVMSLPYWHGGPFSITDTNAVVQQVLPYMSNYPRYNVALLNDNREYKANKYRYFMEVSSTPPQSNYEYSNLDALVVIVENGESPLQSPIYEIQQFVREHNQSYHLAESLSYKGVVKMYIYVRN